MKKYFTITNGIIACSLLGYLYILYLEHNNLDYTENEIAAVSDLLKHYNFNYDNPKAMLKIIEKSVEAAVIVIGVWVLSRI